MALKDRIARDNKNIFMNQDHFAETHTWNGHPFTCVLDDINNNKKIQFNNSQEKIIFVPNNSLPARAEPDTTVIFDGVQMRVMDVIDAIGIKEIHLSLFSDVTVQ